MRDTAETLPFSYPPRPLRPAAQGGVRFQLAPALVLIGSMVFNAGLAIVNGHIFPLSQPMIIAAEAIFVSAALLLVLMAWRPEMSPSLMLMVMLVVIAVARALWMVQPEPKYLRDVLLIPTFFMLGMTFDDRGLSRTVLVIHSIVFVVCLFEALAPQAFSDLFRIQDYYINTRGNSIDEFYNTNSELFISATRPDERFFSFVDWPRLSSIFLEPVSLGNYCTVVTCFICSSFRRMGRLATWYMALGTLFMLIGCDGRLATASCIIIVAVSIIAPRLPRMTPVLYIPGAVAFVIALVTIAGLKSGNDDFGGRLAHTVELLLQFDVPDLAGASNEYINQAMDSGVAYLILTQSLPGFILLWAYIGFGTKEDTAEQVRYTHALTLYLALSMMVSYSFLTIKTAALLWFVQGVLQSSPARHPEDQLTSGRREPISPAAEGRA
jgi:putative polymerase